jgi:hypothetical protein
MIRFDVFDIEKPSSHGKQYVWIAKIDYQKLIADSQQQYDFVLKVNYPVHFRYQSPADQAYIKSALFMKTRMYSNCSFSNLFESDTHDNFFFNEKVQSLLGPSYQKIRLRHFADLEDFKKDQMSDILFASIPVGDINLKRPMLFITLFISLLFAALLCRTFLSSKEPVETEAISTAQPTKKKQKKE